LAALADNIHRPVLYISSLQNRGMLYASAMSTGRGSPFLFFTSPRLTPEDTLAILKFFLKNRDGQCDLTAAGKCRAD
jgi:hypothetical protein